MQQEAGNWKPYNVKAILTNVELVFKTRDITKLNNPTYTFISLMSGFIAHFNLQGFQSSYEDLRELIEDLNPERLRASARRDETDTDFHKWYGAAYNKSRADIKRGLADLSEKYHDEIQEYFTSKERAAAVQSIKQLISNYDITLNELNK